MQRDELDLEVLVVVEKILKVAAHRFSTVKFPRRASIVNHEGVAVVIAIHYLIDVRTGCALMLELGESPPWSPPRGP